MRQPTPTTVSRGRRTAIVLAAMLAAIASHVPTALSFAPIVSRSRSPSTRSIQSEQADVTNSVALAPSPIETIRPPRTSSTELYAEEDSNSDSRPSPPKFDNVESLLLGGAGLSASALMIYSESVLFRTGCGLPAGPGGLIGAAEGLSYLGAVGLAGFSAYTKIRTGKGLPSGPGGILGAAEGMCYLAVFAGFWVLVAQVTNYGYIPNAVPMEGGMCQ